MAYTAFAISEEDVEHVLNKFAVRVANSEGRSFADMADAVWGQLDHGAIERAALLGVELDAQTRYTHDEIAAQLMRLGMLEEPRMDTPRVVAFRVMGNDDCFGPSWVQFEISDEYLARLDEAAGVLRAGEKKAVAGLDLVEVNLNFNGHWRGRQGGFFDESDQTRIYSAMLNLAALPNGTEWPLIMLSTHGSLEHSDSAVQTAPIELEQLKDLHAMRPPGETMVFDHREFANDTPAGVDFLREIREADEAEQEDSHSPDSAQPTFA